MDLFGRKEKILRQEIESLNAKLETAIGIINKLEAKGNKLIDDNEKLKENNKKLKEELEVKDYIGQGIHNILNYNGEPQSKVG